MPPRQPTEHRFAAPDGETCWFEWGTPQPGSSTLLLLHATGFHARLWDKLVDLLPPDQHVIAPDVRGHGRSFRPANLGDWGASASDIVALADALDLSGIVVVGHSMGGFCGAWLAAHRPGRVARLVLVDPVIMPPAHYEVAADQPVMAVEDHPVARRRNHWDSVDQMVERMASRPPYDAWNPAILRDYCAHGLLPLAEGGLELACPPALEASVYLGAGSNSPHGFIGNIQCPTIVVRAKQDERDGLMDFSNSPTWSGLANAIPGARDLHWADRSHFIPMEDPARLAALVTEEIDLVQRAAMNRTG